MIFRLNPADSGLRPASWRLQHERTLEETLSGSTEGLARISHTRCGLRRFKKPTGQKPRAARHRASAATHPVGFFNRPFGLPFGGHLQRRAAQPYARYAFRRPTLYLPRRKSNAGRMECEKCGLGLQLGIELIANRVPEEIECEHSERDCEAGKDRDPRRALGVFLRAPAQHQPPRRHRLLHTEPEIRQ